MPDYFDLAYAAGLTDGEGTVVIEKSRDDKRVPDSQRQYLRSRKHGGVRYRMHVSITNTDMALLDWMLLKFGGHIYQLEKATAKHKATFIWRVAGQEASDFLKAIRPFLKGKGLQADNAIEFQAPIQRQRRKALTDEELATREVQRTLMASLNRKGPAETEK